MVGDNNKISLEAASRRDNLRADFIQEQTAFLRFSFHDFTILPLKERQLVLVDCNHLFNAR